MGITNSGIYGDCKVLVPLVFESISFLRTSQSPPANSSTLATQRLMVRLHSCHAGKQFNSGTFGALA